MLSQSSQRDRLFFFLSVFCKLTIVDEQLICIKQETGTGKCKRDYRKSTETGIEVKTLEQLFNTVTLAGTKSHNETLLLLLVHIKRTRKKGS